MSSESPTLMITNNLALISLLVALLSIFVIVAVARRRSSNRGSTVLLVGPSDAGKTAILTSLLYKRALPTHTSLQTNSSLINLNSSNNKPLRLIDVAGHPRLRNDYKEYIANAKAVAFVVDASTITRNGAAVTEYLHHIMNSLMSLPPKQTPALAILAHKADLLTSTASSNASTPSSRAQLAITRVRTILERELEKRRASHVEGVGIEGLGAEGGEPEMEGGLETQSPGGTFKFSDWEGGEVIFFGTEVEIVQQHQEKVSNEYEKYSADRLEQFIAWLEEIL